jgi:hypothetical protein
MPKQKVFQRINALKEECISIIRRDKLRVILLDEVIASFCSLNMKGVIRIIVSAHSLRAGPDRGNFCLRRVISRYSSEPDMVDDTRDFGT